MRRRTQIVIGLAVALLVLLVTGAVVITRLQSKISKRLEQGWVLPPLELYSQGTLLTPGRRMPINTLLADFKNRGWQAGRDYAVEEGDACVERSTFELPEGGHGCLWIKHPSVYVVWGADQWILQVHAGEPLQERVSFALFPRLITQFFDGQPILQQNTPLSDIPLACLQAVTAIEDKDFLVHRGVSFTGTLRAIVRNLKAGRFAEGGSTITQQLVKNFFLTAKKTLRRKIEEQFLAILLESQISKDQILEMYLNVIYMGQNGPFQVRGFGSAAQFYFDKPVAQLNLNECALMAAMINSPGKYSPFEKQDRARARRELVLKKMRAENMISEAELTAAAAAALPVPSPSQRRTHAPYFVTSALKEFTSWEIEAEEGARIYTTLDPDVQNVIVESVRKILPVVEKRVKTPGKMPLQAVAITVHVPSAQILGLVGGSDYKTTQYNRASEARRQIGSIIKPFVYWPALRDKSPLTTVTDEPFEWKVGKQTWKPRNYDGNTYGPVPYFYALAQSLNIPAAKVGQLVGLEQVMLSLAQTGIQVNAPRLPSLTLGAVELSPLDVAQAYSVLARFGDGDHIHTVERVEDLNGDILFAREPSSNLKLDPVQTATLVGMMRTTFSVGSARFAKDWGLAGDYAGKTGTTSDTKDAWFAGFDGRLLTVVWVGYDDNAVMGLTGAGAALPIWVDIHKHLQSVYKKDDFHWPSGTERRTLSRDKLLDEFPALRDLPEQIELVFPDWAS